jgi:uncharacterized protein YyaL (SSP411 family)
MRSFSRKLASRPLALEQMLLGVDWVTDSVKEIAVILPEGKGALPSAARPLLDVLANHFVPNAVLVAATETEIEGTLGQIVPWTRDKKLRGRGKATAHVCERGACKLPTTSAEVFAKQLADVRPYP